MTAQWTLRLPFLSPPLSENQRLHWAEKNRRVQSVKDAAHLMAVAGRLPKGLERVGITLHWQATLRRRRDKDNPTPTLKAAIDGLVRYGLVEDDDSEHVTASGVVIEELAAKSALWLVVHDMSGAA